MFARARRMGADAGSAGSLFEVFQAGVNDVFDAVEFCAPQVAHVIKARVDSVELGVNVGDEEADEYGVEQHWRTNHDV